MAQESSFPPRRIDIRHLLAGSALICLGAPALAQQAGAPPAPPPPVDTSQPLPEVTVTAERRDLMGTASTASEGVVTQDEIEQAPIYRPGQLLETVPGLIATVHSGEGKANQYLMRGYNLDHGTDLETYVDGMPINQPTHAHGQGYTDLNFMMPELANQITYTKGPYYANVGDFGAVGSVHLTYRDTIEDQASVGVGTLGYERIFTAASQAVGTGHFLEAAEFQHYDGPFVVPDDERKANLVMRYSDGGPAEGFSITGMFYHNDWTNTTDIPIRAIDEGFVANRFGSLDPSDGGHALRTSLSANYHTELGPGQLTASAFFIRNELNLYNDFTHFLQDPVHGDQEDQFETRNVVGNGLSYLVPGTVAGFDNEFLTGMSTRYDNLNVGRLPSEGQMPLTAAQAANDPASFSNHDHVDLFAGALYAQATTHWTSDIRTVLGLRDDYQYGTDHDLLASLHETAGYTNGGTQAKSLLQPKGSVIYAPLSSLEFYVSGGEGFHSADLRGVNQADRYPGLGLPGTPLLARQWGEEVGVRANLRKDVSLTFAVYNLWQQSETIIDPDVGQDSPGPPSERYGFEVNATYQIRQWLELYGSFSGNHVRFTQPFDDGTGHVGEYITDAPALTGSLALYMHDLGPWSGGLAYRYLGDYPLSSGPCQNAAAVRDFPGVATSCANAPTAQGQVNGKGFGQLNLDAHYQIAPAWRASFGIYNLLNTKAAAAEFWYVDRLQSEINTYPDGRADVHQHPLEPLMARVAISMFF